MVTAKDKKSPAYFLNVDISAGLRNAQIAQHGKRWLVLPDWSEVGLSNHDFLCAN